MTILDYRFYLDVSHYWRVLLHDIESIETLEIVILAKGSCLLMIGLIKFAKIPIYLLLILNFNFSIVSKLLN